ncbi:CHAT domain-containing protein [Kribbella sp. VKM Ac-2527]|uniref:CHAT domain-containing protein n=1 Tax=Kribbella caucasensis TaxID=2512215 RepID=A0A4R6KBU9_9ACTN|nr:CHAT domain-containing protein [Kribbella sp. VKM Ac-2527]TDO46723.1 CHAT domain-containing protein [Kribbella sp. VKM Ac-2527]
MGAWWQWLMVAASLAAVVSRTREVAGRRSGCGPVLGSLVVGLLVWGLAAWLLRTPLHWMVENGLATAILLALIGLAVGTYEPLVGYGAAVVYTFWRPEPDLLLWWVLPIVVGYTARRSTTAFRGSEWWNQKGLRRELVAIWRGPQPPGLADRAMQYGALVAGAIPAVAAVAVVSWGPSAVGDLPLLLGGLLITGQCWLWHYGERRLTRPYRKGSRFSQMLFILGGIGLAATPLGELVVRAWRAVDAPVVAGIAVALAGVAAAMLLTLVLRRSMTSRRRTGLTLLVGGNLNALFISRGLFVFSVAGLFQPEPALLWAALGLVSLEALRSVWDIWFTGWTNQRRGDISRLVGYDDHLVDQVLNYWGYDALLAHPARPDLSMVDLLSEEALRAAHGSAAPLQGMFDSAPGGAEPLTGQHALRWIEIAERAIQLAESEVLPRIPEQHRPLLTKHLASVRVQCALIKGNVYQYLNWPEEAVQAWHEAVQGSEALGWRQMAAVCASSEAIGWAARLARPDEALAALAPYLEQDLAPPVRRHVLLQAGFVTATVDPDRAKLLLDEAQQIRWRPRDLKPLLREAGDPGVSLQVFIARRRLAGVVRSMEDMTLALWPVPEHVPANRRLPAFPRELEFPGRRRTISGLNRLSEGNPAAAIPLLLDGAEHAARDGHLSWVVQAHAGLADAYLEESDPIAAYRHLRLALTAREQIHERVLDSDDRIDVAGRTSDLYTLGVHLLVISAEYEPSGEGWPEQPYAEALMLVERARSRVFLQLLGEALPEPLDSSEEELFAAERAAYKAYRNASPDRVRQARDALEETWAGLASTDDGAEYAALRRGDPISYPEIQELLRADPPATLVEYYVGEEETYVFVATAAHPQPQVFTVELGREQIRNVATDAFGAGHGAPRLLAVDLAEWQDVLRPLVEPVFGACGDGDLLCLAPHDVLHYLPLHAIPVDGVTLADRHPVCYSPSASVMKYAQAKRVDHRETPLILADAQAEAPLPHARHQARAISALFDSGDPPLIGPVADLATIHDRLAASDRPDILHLACHGTFDPEHPERSGIVLADGPLTVQDILGLRLDLDLVTLSACDSGVSQNRPGDELIGLTRAFIYAGTPSVLVSLWSVDEVSTGLLMTAFYRGLRAGLTKADALRAAQREVRTATISDVLQVCAEARLAAAGAGDEATVRLLDRDIADLHYQARDFATALSGYQALADTASGAEQHDGAEERELVAAVARARRAMRAAGPVDYAATPFSHPYHWAPFVLMGDWR